jgi:hypothetical protein
MKIPLHGSWLPALLVLYLAGADRSEGGARSKVAQETAEYVLQRFGRQAAREGAEGLARKIEVYASRHGDEFVQAVRKVGPRTFHLVEEAGVNGGKAVQVMARHGEHGATWVVARPKGMQLFLQHGDEAANVLVKHKAVAEPLIEHLGQPAVKALQAANTQSGRRLAMLLESGELAKIGRHEEVLEVVAKYGDRAMTFVWENKGALATTAGLAAFLANPEAFINGARDITQIVGENAIKPVIEAPVAVATEVARGTNWTVIFILAGMAVVAWFAFTRLGLGAKLIEGWKRQQGGPNEPAARPGRLGRHVAALLRRLTKR